MFLKIICNLFLWIKLACRQIIDVNCQKCYDICSLRNSKLPKLPSDKTACNEPRHGTLYLVCRQFFLTKIMPGICTASLQADYLCELSKHLWYLFTSEFKTSETAFRQNCLQWAKTWRVVCGLQAVFPNQKLCLQYAH